MWKVLFRYIPTVKQTLFHKTKALHKLFWGAAGGGKTDALLAESLMLCMKYPWIKGLFVRRTYWEIEETINERLPKMLQDEEGKPAGYHIRKNVLYFNGGQIVLWYWQDDRRNDRYFGTEYDFIAVDELTRTIYKKSDLQKLLARNRTSKAHLHAMWFVPYFMAGTNPGGLGHNYVKEVFIDGKPWTKFKKSDFVFVPSRLEDNPHLLKADPNYERRLESISDENLRKALRYGEWNVFEGQFFPEYMETMHCVPFFQTTYKITKTVLCLDYGYRKPSAVYLLRRDSEGIIWITHELYVTEHTYGALGEAIKSKYENFNPEYIIADPAIFAKNGWDNSGAEIIQAKSWLRVFPANNSRQMGWNLVKTLLINDRIKIQNNCNNLKTEFWAAVYDSKSDNDLDSNQPDHALDSVRYGCMDIAGDVIDTASNDIKDMNEKLEKDESENLSSMNF